MMKALLVTATLLLNAFPISQGSNFPLKAGKPGHSKLPIDPLEGTQPQSIDDCDQELQRPTKRDMNERRLRRRLGGTIDERFLSITEPLLSSGKYVKRVSLRGISTIEKNYLREIIRNETVPNLGKPSLFMERFMMKWLIQKSDCPVEHIWKDLGFCYWPRWISVSDKSIDLLRLEKRKCSSKVRNHTLYSKLASSRNFCARSWNFFLFLWSFHVKAEKLDDAKCRFFTSVSQSGLKDTGCSLEVLLNWGHIPVEPWLPSEVKHKQKLSSVSQKRSFFLHCFAFDTKSPRKWSTDTVWQSEVQTLKLSFPFPPKLKIHAQHSSKCLNVDSLGAFSEQVAIYPNSLTKPTIRSFRGKS